MMGILSALSKTIRPLVVGLTLEQLQVKVGELLAERAPVYELANRSVPAINLKGLTNDDFNNLFANK